MPDLATVMLFYSQEAWSKDDSGTRVPSGELLADQGRMMHQFMHPSEHGLPTENIVKANYHISAAEIAECLRDLYLVMKMPSSQHRSMTVGTLCSKLQNAEYRLRMVTRT